MYFKIKYDSSIFLNKGNFPKKKLKKKVMNELNMVKFPYLTDSHENKFLVVNR